MLRDKHFAYLLYRLWNKKTFFIFLTCCLITTHLSPVSADQKNSATTGSITTVYDLFTNGNNRGNISMSRSQYGDGENRLYIIKESVFVTISGFWENWEITSTGETVLDKKGFLVRFDNKIKENKNNWRVFGERHDLELWCGARKVLTSEEREEKDILALSSAVAAKTIPYAGEALTVFGLLSPHSDQEGEIRIPLDSFDTTLAQLGSVLLNKPQGVKKEKIRVLDTSELKTETYIFNELAPSEITTAGQTFYCRIFNATHPQGKSTYWLAKDTLGAFFVKESGKDDDGPYEIILKQYN